MLSKRKDTTLDVIAAVVDINFAVMPEKDIDTDKPSWADQVEAAGSVPPPTEVIEGDTKVVTQYRRMDNGKLQKIIRTYRIEKRQLSKKIAQRKTWKKFGQAAYDLSTGPDPATTQVADDMFLTLVTNKESLEQEEDPLKKLQKIVQCRICKGDHWTTKCPYKDTLGPIVREMEAESKGGQTEARVKGVAVAGKYVAPGRREDGGDRRGESMSMRRDDQATLRVTNLSDETTEADLQELFRRFGAIARIYLAKDKITQRSKGFAFVNYHHKEDAARAIQALDGYGYDHLILSVEWARPSQN